LWGADAVFGGYQEPAFVAAAHAAGMKVYAEFGCFVGTELWEKYPASRPVTDDGRLLEPQDWYYGVNPSVPAVREDRLAALERLAGDYPIDGVWLDFIRWPCRWESPDPVLPHTSFDEATLVRFEREAGVSVVRGDVAGVARTLLDRHADDWTRWRCDQITSWVSQARMLVKRLRPAALLGLFVVPWRLADYNGAILRIVGQDTRGLGEHVDVLSPMVYHRMCGQAIAWIHAVTEEVGKRSGRPVWPVIQSVDQPGPLPADEYARALDIAQESPASAGVIVFTLEGALEESKLAATRDRFTAAR
jgi:uncharacterized lipoprotein YddW (UPF0748 family)